MFRFFASLILFFSLLSSAYADAAFVNRQDVHDFIEHMVHRYHFKKSELVALFSQVKIRPQVMHHINKPLEKEFWRTYQMLFVNEWRIQHGVEYWQAHEATLNRAEQVYGVPAGIIVATIGIETKYGQKMGEYRVIDSLSNIAFSNSTRKDFFQNELQEFLLLVREQHLNPLKIMGSYAGAIGQPQFMPSSYRRYAVKFSPRGPIDLIHNDADVIGSVANYYKRHGWKKEQPIAAPVLLLSNRYSYLLEHNKIQFPLTAGALPNYGIIPKTKIDPDDAELHVQLVALESRYNTEYWVGFNNFSVIKLYNPSDLYAMAVYQLASYTRALRDKLDHA
ncbi:MAG TPA: lytic murein transglycosylase B [Gammaproteobacteria bacterium]|nr:lytic murein transglycosylase B [Gammaproteobacteria bacterium]